MARNAAGVRSAMALAGALYSPEHLHDVRMAVKKLRYTAELSREGRGQPRTVDIAALKTVQDRLGCLHDLEVLLERVRRVQASLSPPDRRAWRELGSLAHAVEDNCRRWHARYMRDRSTLLAIAGRMGAKLRSTAGVRRRAAG
jgi:CHAD domain-containing protein